MSVSVAGAGGGAPGDFCTGDAKVSYQGDVVSAAATYCEFPVVMDCCNGYGVHLRTKEALGLDFDVGLTLEGPLPAKLDVGLSGVSTAEIRPSDALGAWQLAAGTVTMDYGPDSGLTTIGFCLEVTDSSSELFGTRVYVPRVEHLEGSPGDRLEIYLLEDPSLTSRDTDVLSLDSLVLAEQPLLDLFDITFMQPDTGDVGVNPSAWYPAEGLGDKLGDVPLYGLPFVVVADGERIYQGAFMTMISSVLTRGPQVMVERSTPDGFVIEPPVDGTDPRNDSRILAVLTQTSRRVW